MKKIGKKLFPVVLSIILIIGMFPMTAFAVEAETTTTKTFEVSTEAELLDAVTAINEEENTDVNYVISLQKDITTSGALNFKKNTTTIVGNGKTLTFTGSEYAIYVNSGDSTWRPVLILGKSSDSTNTLTIKSTGKLRNDGAHFIIVGDSGNNTGHGTVKMYDGVTITDVTTSNTFGGAFIVGNGGSFEMNGGLITNCGVASGSVCHGGGVATISGGIFTMNGGTISKCYASSEYDSGNGWQVPSSSGGGVFVGNGSTFVMNGGTIEENSAYWDGGGVMVMNSYGSVLKKNAYGYLDSKFVMNGGTIKNNSCTYAGGGVAVMGTYVIAAAIATTSPLPGMPSDPGVYINGGTIEGNSSEGNGGGIFVNWIRPSIPVQIHGATITNNTADTGAGIDVLSYWSKVDIDSCTIANNAATGNGGGIAITKNSSNNGGTTLKNTTITGNTSGKIGAGVYYDAQSILKISGANVIQNNKYIDSDTSVEKINNLNIYDEDHPVYVTGSLAGSSIGLSDPTLWNDGKTDEDETAVSTSKLTRDYKTYNADITPDTVFTSDHNTWTPDYGEVKEETYSMGWSSTATAWTASVTDYIYGVAVTEPYSTGNKIYYNATTKEFTKTSSGNYSVSVILKDGKYYLAYKDSKTSSYYVLQKLDEPEAHTYTLTGREMTYDLFEVNCGIDGINYFRISQISNSSTKTIYCYEWVKKGNGDGYDYSNEVHLTRAYTIKYLDGDSSADFGSADYPKVYVKGNVVSLVSPAAKAGYTFEGWYRDADFTDGPVTELSASEVISSDGYITLYAKWTKNADPEPDPQPTPDPKPTPDPTPSPDPIPQTGDASDLSLWIMLSMGAVFGLAGCVTTMIRKKRTQK